jgi:hypothetical protein
MAFNYAERSLWEGFIAARVKVKAEPVVNKQLELAKSLVVIDGVSKGKYDAEHPLVRIKDLGKRQISNLLATGVSSGSPSLRSRPGLPSELKPTSASTSH